MKLGLIADIHADYAALTTVLARLESRHRVDEILCAGDLTGYGRHPDQVVTLLRERRIATVRGSHDSPSPHMRPADAAYLQSLPFDWRGTLHGRRIFLCHGMPSVNFVGLTPAILDKPSVQRVLADLHADIVIAGHTHRYMCQSVGSTWVVNPGSVYSGTAHGTSHTYGVLDLERGRYAVFDLLLPVDAPPVESFLMTQINIAS
jgi:putative phosphoesterase